MYQQQGKHRKDLNEKSKSRWSHARGDGPKVVAISPDNSTITMTVPGLGNFKSGFCLLLL